MQATTRKFLSYYRNTLSDAVRQNPDLKAFQKEGKLLLGDEDAFLSWRRPADEDLDRFLAAAKSGAEKGSGEGGEEDASVEGVFCPWIYLPDVVHGASRSGETFALLCVPAVLASDGTFRPTGALPWIPRSLLQPLNDDSVTVGTVEDSDAFLGSLDASALGTWSDVPPLCRKYLGAVTGAEDPPDFEGYRRDVHWAFFSGATIQASKHVATLYEALLQKDLPLLPLLDRIVHGTAETSPLLTPPEGVRASQRHWGTMSAEFPLSPSQRRAMHHFLQMEDGEVLALNGPPGTGKTTILQSIVAQIWVDAAYHRKECPLMVASSTNNQAVTNIIDSFGNVKAPEGDPLYQRWVPDVHSFGLQMAREKRWGKEFHAYDMGFPQGKPQVTGFFAQIETPEWLKGAEDFFLKQCALRYGAVKNLEAAVEAVHAELSEGIEGMAALLETASALAEGDLDAQLFHRHAQACQALEAQRAALARDREALGARKKTLEETVVAWEQFVASESFLLALCSFLPPIRKKREAATRCFLLSRGRTEEEIDRDRVAETFRRELRELTADGDRLDRALEDTAGARRQREERWASWEVALAPLGLDAQKEELSLRKLMEKIDTKARSKAFYLATHYWEGQYLLELRRKLQPNGEYRDSSAPDKKARMYRRFAKLTPCQIVTFYMLPNYYCGYNKQPAHLFGKIDLLIVDEAGQVSPEVGTPSFALARRALVVGDTFQIEPVWSVTRRIDEANAQESGVVASREEYEKALSRGFLAASGNLMRMAQRACRYTEYPDLAPGLMLTEHRRCVPEIIAYCNDLVYKGKLEPCRKESDEERSQRPAFLPPLGEIDVKGTDELAGGSRKNESEAHALAEWVKTYAPALRERYKDKKRDGEKELTAILGIITPFAAQKHAISQALTRALGEGHNITVGTVHALQGAERPVVLFSPTYGVGHSGTTFFDTGDNMMNVAVSRAKDSFLVIGNLDLFREESASPSGLLAQHIRRRRNGEDAGKLHTPDAE